MPRLFCMMYTLRGEDSDKQGLPRYRKVDAYLIPEHEADRYEAEREEAKALALEAMRSFCHSAGLDFAGSQDGEAVLGYDEAGACVALIHLDPEGVKQILAAHREGRLEALLRGE